MHFLEILLLISDEIYIKTKQKKTFGEAFTFLVTENI
jgi:hypothetical protein